MKNFNKKIYSLNISSLQKVNSVIPQKYFNLAINIANSFSKEYSSIGVMNTNDLIQEACFALVKSWKNIKNSGLFGENAEGHFLRFSPLGRHPKCKI